MDQLLADEFVNDLEDAGENETLWALTDRQGSITDMVDDAGTLRLHRLFNSYGNIASETHYDETGDTVTSLDPGYLDEAFAYTGRLLDKATGLQNNLNRWYDASIGRWMSEDPIGFEAGDANLYRYVGNSPLNGTDPSGLTSKPVPPKPWPIEVPVDPPHSDVDDAPPDDGVLPVLGLPPVEPPDDHGLDPLPLPPTRPPKLDIPDPQIPPPNLPIPRQDRRYDYPCRPHQYPIV